MSLPEELVSLGKSVYENYSGNKNNKQKKQEEVLRELFHLLVWSGEKLDDLFEESHKCSLFGRVRLFDDSLKNIKRFLSYKYIDIPKEIHEDCSKLLKDRGGIVSKYFTKKDGNYQDLSFEYASKAFESKIFEKIKKRIDS